MNKKLDGVFHSRNRSDEVRELVGSDIENDRLHSNVGRQSHHCQVSIRIMNYIAILVKRNPNQ